MAGALEAGLRLGGVRARALDLVGPDLAGGGIVGAAALGDHDRESGVDMVHERTFARLIAGIGTLIGSRRHRDLLAGGLAFAAAQYCKNVENRPHRPTP